MALHIVLPWDPTGIISERETGKLDESNHSNLLKAWYIVSRTISNNLGSQRQARLSFGKGAPVSFQGLMQSLVITKLITQREEKQWPGGGEGCRSPVLRCPELSWSVVVCFFQLIWSFEWSLLVLPFLTTAVIIFDLKNHVSLFPPLTVHQLLFSSLSDNKSFRKMFLLPA